MNNPQTIPATFTTGHVGLNVTDLSRSIRFYQGVFGFRIAGASRDGAREYAFLSEGETLVLTLWRQSDGAFDARRAGLHHLSFQVRTMDDVKRVEQRLRDLGAKLHHGGIVPHGEGTPSGGIFFEDPDGIRLEVFAGSGAEAHTAPTPGAPTCGFF